MKCWKYYVLICNFALQNQLLVKTGLQTQSKPFVTYKGGLLQPAKSIAFLKTHKCSSVTVQNILLRYAKKHVLNLVLGKTGNLIGYPDGFSIKAIENTPWYQAGIQPDIFCCHSRWSNFSAVKQIMGSDTIFFTIIRDPIDTFISMWDYYQIDKQYMRTNISIDDFFKQPLNPKVMAIKNNEYSLKHVLFHEFGLPLDATEEMVDQKIQEIDQTFDLVMIVEHFDDSMVFLKNLLQWNFEDLSSLKLNGIAKGMKSKVSDATRLKMRTWLETDYKLYDYFKHKLEQNMKYFGDFELNKELEIYHQVQERVKEKCPMKIIPRINPWGAKTERYEMLNEDPECQMIGMREVVFLEKMRKEQNERIYQRQNT